MSPYYPCLRAYANLGSCTQCIYCLQNKYFLKVIMQIYLKNEKLNKFANLGCLLYQRKNGFKGHIAFLLILVKFININIS